MATRDLDVAEAIDVVKKLATRNPQKLRQIGMNYDMANAKGVLELQEEDEEKKVSEEKEVKENKIKENEVEEKKAGETTAEDKRKAELEPQKDDASYVAAKQHKQAEEKDKADHDSGSQQQTKDSDTQKEQSGAPTDTNANTEQQPVTDVTKLAAKAQAQPPTSDSDLTKLLLLLAEHILHPPATPTDMPALSSPDLVTNPTTTDAPGLPETSDATTTSSDKDKEKEQKSWNAVCTLGLRVYSLDPNVTIQLIKPQSAAETSILDVDGATQAGATM